MKKLVLIRFGLMPMPEVTQVLGPHFVGQGEMLVMPGAIISTFTTNSEREEIAKQLSEIPGCVFFLVEARQDCLSIELPEPLKSEISRSLGLDVPTNVPQHDLTYYRKQLNVAIESEDFEQAATLRDKIKEIEENEK